MAETFFPTTADIVVAKRTGQTTNFTSDTLSNPYGKAMYVVLDITSVPGTDTVQLIIEFYDEASDKWISIINDTAQSTAVTRTVLIGGGTITAGDGVSIIRCRAIPATIRLRVVHSAATSFNYTLGVHFCL